MRVFKRVLKHAFRHVLKRVPKRVLKHVPKPVPKHVPKRIPRRVPGFVLPLLVLVAGAGAFAWFKSTEVTPEPLRPQDRAPVVSVQVVAKTAASPSLRIFGQVETPDMSVLTAGVAADIIEVKVLEGNTVRRGQEVIVMDDADAALEILQRQADLAEIEALLESDKIKLRADQAALEAEETLLALARKAVERARRLARSQAGSEASLDQARENEQRQLLAITERRQAIADFASRQLQLRARYDKAAAVLKRAERDHRRTRVKAPFDGRVTEVMVSRGDRAANDTQLLRLYDESQLELRAQVPSAHLAVLRRALDAGQPLRAEAVTVGGGERIRLALHRLSASVDQGQGGIDAFFRARSGRLPVPGGTLEVNLKLPPMENVIVLSPDALYGRDRVYRVQANAQGNVLQSRTVRRLGQLNDAQGRRMLIVAGDGFEAGDQILNSRLPQAVDGLKVKVER